MAITPTQRRTPEWFLLILALAIVGVICVPLWQWSGRSGESFIGSLRPERLGRLLLGPEQIASYCCFVWASFILITRYLEVRRQRRAFKLDLLPTEEGVRILPEDSRPLLRKVEEINNRRGPFILANMIRLALGKYAVSRSGQDVSEAIGAQADVDLGRFVSNMATVNYLAWALPALGFLGTVRGLSGALSMAGQIDDPAFIETVSKHLTVAFDCTLVALVLSVVMMFWLHRVQRDEESLVIDCRQYCLEHLVNRLYDLETISDEAEPDRLPVRPAVAGRMSG
jgi:biopolymer transport protein ExbB/TolQ